ncbi:MAG: outer membrane protein transport protein [Gammaproteobacteria bacterium]|nr:outer membrane protein transport protein [Gammaproteobacteria bacterium]
MKRLRLSLLTLSVSSLFMSQTVFAAAFQLYELGTPIIGTAGAGQAAVANDASTTYFNPAGMTQFKNSQFMLGSQIVLPFTNFSKNNNNTITGDNGGNAATLIPGLDIYYISNYSSKLKLGISLTSPYGGMLNYTNGWVGRYVVQQMQMYTLDLNPTVAYQINDWAAIGAGVTVEYANLQETIAIPLIPLVDGQANVKLSNTAGGANLGFLFTPTPNTKLGVAYRSQISHRFTGNTTFLRISDNPATTSRIIMPQNIMISLAQGVTNNFSILGDLGWANWASMRNTLVTIDRYSIVTPLNWTNTYRVGLGGQYKATPLLLIQAGASYDSSPTTSSKRLPDLPMDRQLRIGTGVIYTVIPAVKLGFSYEYINFGSAKINNTSSAGVLAGSYTRNYGNVLQASINVAC